MGRILKFLKDFKWLIIFFIVLEIAITFIVPKTIIEFRVNGASMNNTLQNGDLMVGRQYIFDKPDYEDIIIFKAPSGDDYIKRVIGLPGDSIKIENNIVYRNGNPIKEDYIKKPEQVINVKETKLPDNKYFVMGDNRDNSVDSRYTEVGLVDMSKIESKIYMRFKPNFKLFF